ncbi:MAG TPA: ATP-binding protein [Candidatus Saccharimonadales bacterium]|nr:ATP-binding protein [Candidatus Saccharimonadales bacterium]
MDKSIRAKLLSSFLFIIVILFISEGFLLAINLNIINYYSRMMDNMISEYKIIGVSSSIVESFKNVIKNPSDQEKEQKLKNDKQDLEAVLLILDQKVYDYNSQLIYTGLKNTINNLLGEVDHGVSVVSVGDYSDITTHYEDVQRLNDFIKENTTQLILAQLAYMEVLDIKIDQVRLLSELIAILMFILVSIGCVWYSISFSRKLIYPLAKLTRLAKNIENGDLQASVDKKLLASGDEVASLANSFNAMTVYLRSSIAKLKESNFKIEESRNHLKSEKNKLQQYLDVAGVIVLIFSPGNNNVRLINKKGRELLGITSSEIIDKNWISLFVDKKSQLKTISFLNLVSSGIDISNDTLENVLLTKIGQIKNVVWHVTALKDENGLVSSILATGADVTELTSAKMTISQLREVDRVKNEVMNIATHELKTPLISIIGLSEVMGRNLSGLSDDYKNYISIIHTEGVKLNNLIKTMLSSTRSELGKPTMTSTEFNLVELVLSLETSLKVLANRTNSVIIFDVKAQDIILKSDKDKIAQVVYNFVDNAVKYGAKEQKIIVSLSQPEPNSVKVAVTDEGKGISVENQKKMFLKFSQLEPSLSRSQEGMGLGLYICKQNIENLGGQIGVTSKLNQGSTFYFTFPITKNVSDLKTKINKK